MKSDRELDETGEEYCDGCRYAMEACRCCWSCGLPPGEQCGEDCDAQEHAKSERRNG